MLLNIPFCSVSESRDIGNIFCYQYFSCSPIREVTLQLGFGIPHTTFLATEVLFSAQHENQV